MKAKLIEIIWVDIQTDPGWHDEPNDKLVDIKSYGLYVKKTKNAYILASGWDSELRRWSDLMKYPVGCVKRIRVVEIVEI